MARIGITAGRRGPRRFLWTALAAVAAALCVGVTAALATEYYSGPVYANTTITSVADNTCQLPYWITYDEFDKGTADYGRVFFINDGGTWLDERSGYGDIATSTGSNYKFQKRAAIRNPQNIGYTGSAYFGVTGQGGQCV